jgi:hemoglobin
MKRFWRSVLFSSGEFFGNPMIKHITISELNRPHFVRWLELFESTLRELGSEDACEHVHSRARMIASSLLNGIAIHREGRLGLRPEEAFA